MITPGEAETAYEVLKAGNQVRKKIGKSGRRRRRRKKTPLFWVIAIIILIWGGSYFMPEQKNSGNSSNMQTTSTQSVSTKKHSTKKGKKGHKKKSHSSKKQSNKKSNKKNVVHTKKLKSKKKNRVKKSKSGSVTVNNWKNKIPAVPKTYNGSNGCVVVNNDNPFFTTKDKKKKRAFEHYSKLDSLGRCGAAYINACKETMPREGERRGAIGMVKPTGWQTIKFPGIVEGNYCYNRCHLAAWELSSENANMQNLVTGTRYMNVGSSKEKYVPSKNGHLPVRGGQLPLENAVHDYLESHPNNHVLYRVTPLFRGNNELCDGVLEEAYSVEDHGNRQKGGIKFCRFCYNIQPGISINYRTGEANRKDGKYGRN